MLCSMVNECRHINDQSEDSQVAIKIMYYIFRYYYGEGFLPFLSWTVILMSSLNHTRFLSIDEQTLTYEMESQRLFLWLGTLCMFPSLWLAWELFMFPVLLCPLFFTLDIIKMLQTGMYSSISIDDELGNKHTKD